MLKTITAAFILTLLGACSSSKWVPTTDVCSLHKHWKDNLFQVRINDKPINNHWYIYQDAVEITARLAEQNKCMR